MCALSGVFRCKTELHSSMEHFFLRAEVEVEFCVDETCNIYDVFLMIHSFRYKYIVYSLPYKV